MIMNSKGLLLAAAIGVTLVCTLTISAQSPSAAPAGVQKWEHLAMTVATVNGPGDADASRKIQQLGHEGWELIDVEALTKEGTTTQLIYFFKRAQ
jgi:hypothetical protein